MQFSTWWNFCFGIFYIEECAAWTSYFPLCGVFASIGGRQAPDLYGKASTVPAATEAQELRVHQGGARSSSTS